MRSRRTLLAIILFALLPIGVAADVALSGLPTFSGAPASSDIVPVVHSGTTYKMPLNQLTQYTQVWQPSGTASGGSTHLPSNALTFTASDWTGSAAISNVLTCTVTDTGNPGMQLLSCTGSGTPQISFAGGLIAGSSSYGPTSANVAGTMTATTFSGSCASCTSIPASALSGFVAVVNGGNGTTSPSLAAGTGLSSSGSWAAQTLSLSTPVSIANGGTGTASPGDVAGTGISTSGTWPTQTIALATPVSIANGGNGTASPGIVAGTGLATSGTWPTQTLGLSTPVSIANGGTGTASPGDVAGTGIATSGSWPTQTISLSTPVSVANGGTGASSLTGSRCLASNSGGTAIAVAAQNCRQPAVTGANTWTNTTMTAATATNVGSAVAPALGVSTMANGNWLITVQLDFIAPASAAGFCAITSSATPVATLFSDYSTAAGTHTSNISNNLSDNAWTATTTAFLASVKYIGTFANSTTPSFQGQCYTAASSKVVSGSISVVAEPN